MVLALAYSGGVGSIFGFQGVYWPQGALKPPPLKKIISEHAFEYCTKLTSLSTCCFLLSGLKRFMMLWLNGWLILLRSGAWFSMLLWTDWSIMLLLTLCFKMFWSGDWIMMLGGKEWFLVLLQPKGWFMKFWSVAIKFDL